MNLRSIDLNLLVVLDALLDEAHVSRAAERLALSQPATSSALERCRHLFKDQLLVRSTGLMKLTAKAQSLRAPIKQALHGVTSVFSAPDIDLKSLTGCIRVGVADALLASMLVPLHKELQKSAPYLSVAYLPWHAASDELRRLEQGELDLAISVIPAVSGDFRRIELLQEQYVVAMRKNHPISKSFTLDSWLAYPHVVVSSRGDMRGTLDDALIPSGKRRHVGVVVPSFLAVFPLLERTDYISLIPSRCILPVHHKTLAVFEPPIALEGFGLHLAWHQRKDGDPATQHVASVLREVVSGL
ncbi:LysR family transcriptional regulator [Variovorax sp. PCZ-1]|uniref:LysR family transcriptional regulator n=1 Tax=Variovorax sp. PCZ-1 TaxID=2835533 RepID=UPI001BCC81CE|nr:LysR family transcriptional regulator [Variovorax sp. PCZ-1]MBS7807789.1 LysR family transcriptional regulator [Variovorax sp. PCZ-1]